MHSPSALLWLFPFFLLLMLLLQLYSIFYFLTFYFTLCVSVSIRSNFFCRFLNFCSLFTSSSFATATFQTASMTRVCRRIVNSLFATISIQENENMSIIRIFQSESVYSKLWQLNELLLYSLYILFSLFGYFPVVSWECYFVYVCFKFQSKSPT